MVFRGGNGGVPLHILASDLHLLNPRASIDLLKAVQCFVKLPDFVFFPR